MPKASWADMREAIWLATLDQCMSEDIDRGQFSRNPESEIDYDWGNPAFRRALGSGRSSDFRGVWPHSPDFEYFEIDL